MKEAELATTSLESEYLHRDSQCKMLIGGIDISNDVITLGTCFSMLVRHSRSFPLRAYWPKPDSSVDREPHRNWRWNSNSREVVASSSSFYRPATRALRGACSQAIIKLKQWKMFSRALVGYSNLRYICI